MHDSRIVEESTEELATSAAFKLQELADDFYELACYQAKLDRIQREDDAATYSVALVDLINLAERIQHDVGVFGLNYMTLNDALARIKVECSKRI